MPIDTDRQQEDQHNAARFRAGTSNDVGAIARSFHLRLSRIEAAIEAAVENHACVPGECGICQARGILAGAEDCDIEDHDYDMPEPIRPPAAPKPPKVDSATIPDAEAF